MADDARVTLADGNGGARTRALVDGLFARHLGNPALDTRADAVAVPLAGGELVCTTDGFVVQPLEFPGGSIGSLAIHGTVNDLAVAGAEPRVLTLAAIIEEGLPLALLARVVADAGRAAVAAGVQVVAGDTKVVPRGEGGGLYLATTGLGVRRAALPGFPGIRAGDAVVVSGPVGDHGAAVLLARGEFGLGGDLASDSASVWPLVAPVLGLPGLRFLRDPTRGGLATVAHELAAATGLGVRLAEAAIPLRPAVVALTEVLGFDPLYLACEGRVVAVVAAAAAPALLAAWQATPGGAAAAIVGTLTPTPAVVLATAIGGERLLPELADDPLPRIC